MELRLDLHIHSERSFDGCMSLSEIVALARERGLNGVAICDHDRVLDEVPEFDDFLVIPATEVSTERGHLLGLGDVGRDLQPHIGHTARQQQHGQQQCSKFCTHHSSSTGLPSLAVSVTAAGWLPRRPSTSASEMGSSTALRMVRRSSRAP
mgnify:FL=1